MKKGEGPVVETRDLTRGEDVSEEQAVHPRAAKRGDFRVPPPDDTIPAPKPGGAGYRFVKRIFDIAFSASVCAVLALPVAVLCLFVAIDSPGAPFFRQERIGLNGKKIRIWKIRTMVTDAHTNPQRYMTPEQPVLPPGAYRSEWQEDSHLEDSHHGDGRAYKPPALYDSRAAGAVGA